MIQFNLNQHPQDIPHRNGVGEAKIWKHKRSQLANAILCNNNNVGGIAIPGPKIDYRAIVIKRALHWHKNKHVGKWNKTENMKLKSSDI